MLKSNAYKDGWDTDLLFRVVATLDSRDDEYVCLCLSKNGDLLSGHESKFKVWSCATDYHKWILLHVVHIPEKGNVTCITQFPNVDDKYAVSINNCVAIYALTRDSAFKPLHMFHFSGDEINQVDIHPRASFICAGDDSGDIKVIDVENLCVCKTLTRHHKNICSTVKFNPRKPWEVFSGGLDCQLIRWDFSRGRPLFVFDVQTSFREKKQALESYVVNPPMVHCVDVLSSIHCVVCALGNGSVAVYSASSPKQLEAICSAHLHSTSVACVCCIEIPGQEPTHVVVSGGNDGNICVSILKYERPGEQVKTQKKQRNQLQQRLGELNLIVTIEHGSKVNWMAVSTCNNSRSAESLMPGKTIMLSHTLMIAVADQTSVAKVYEVNF